MDFIKLIKNNRLTQNISPAELKNLLIEADKVYTENFPAEVYFERSIFINWTCAIANCKYCYLSTKPKYNPQSGTKAIRSQESILAEVLICRLMNWKIGYITGGLRVESAEYLMDLISKINLITKEKTMMNFGPYSEAMVKKFAPHISGMGSAIESFNEPLHDFICPSKPLKSLIDFLGYLQQEKLQKLITIILGLGETKEDLEIVVENIRRYHIEMVQLCFLKPQENTFFKEVPPPNPEYMAWWIAKLRLACPQLKIKVALVRERIKDLSLYLQAGANGFSRFMVFSDFASKPAQELIQQCQVAGRKLIGEFTRLPYINLREEIKKLGLDHQVEQKLFIKAEQYYKRLQNLENNSRLAAR